jgi:topoisomerase-4 subunit A
VAALPDGRGMGAPLSSFVDMGNSKIAHVLVGASKDEFLIAKTSGYGFICAYDDLLSRQKAGKAFLTMEDDAAILPPSPLVRGSAGMDHIAALSSDGRLLVFPLDQMKRLSGGKGVQIIGLKGKESLKSAITLKGSVVRIEGVFRNRPKKLLSEEKHLGLRARRGATVGLLNNPMISGLETETSESETN